MAARIAFVVVMLAVASASAGQFKHGLGSSDKVVLNIPHPPDALIKAKNLRVEWEASTTSFAGAEQVRIRIQQVLGKEFSFGDSNPDATVKLSLLGYQPISTRTYTQTESRSMKVGDRITGYDKNGKAKTEPVYENRQVPVEYWEANGAINVNVAVVDKAGTPIDAFSPSGGYTNKRQIAVNNESSLGRTSLPSAEALEGMMYAQVSGQVQKRYTATLDPVDVMLAVDSELRLGNKLAQSGQWGEALASWKAAKLKKNPGDQTFNIAVSKEAMAYAEYARSQSLEDMMPLFKDAMDLYEQALKQDPAEKYMQNQVRRLTLAKTNIDNVRKHYEDQRAEAEKAAEEARKVLAKKAEEDRRKLELEAAVKDLSADTAEEAKFRPTVRMRVAAIQGDITEQQTKDLISFGQRVYGLNEMKSTRVVLQEVERNKNVAQKLKDYEDTFTPFIADKVLSRAERNTLRDVQKNLGLEDSEVRTIEAKYKFVEARAPSETKPSTSVVVPKKSTPTIRKVPVPAKPAPTQPGIGGSAVKPKQ